MDRLSAEGTLVERDRVWGGVSLSPPGEGLQRG